MKKQILHIGKILLTVLMIFFIVTAIISSLYGGERAPAALLEYEQSVHTLQLAQQGACKTRKTLATAILADHYTGALEVTTERIIELLDVLHDLGDCDFR